MRRYWIEANQKFNDRVTWNSSQLHHIFEVCRQDVGSKFEVIHPDHHAYLVEVISVSKKLAEARILEAREIPSLPRPHIHLALSLPRFPVLESVLEKAVEMGVHKVHLFTSDYSFLRETKKITPDKIERWKKIVVSATQQSGRGELMEITPPENFENLVKKINPGPSSLCLFAYEGGSTMSIKRFILQKKTRTKPEGEPGDEGTLDDLWIIVGSEGGFSHQEVGFMSKQGFHPVTLGPQVLRVETACMTLVSVLKYEFELMR